jgi:GTP cyclohydrolase II
MLTRPKPLRDAPTVSRYAEADVPTDLGAFRLVVYRDPQSPFEHTAIVRGELRGASDVLVRVHSECFTGEVLHSLKCDCRAQLDLALQRIADAGRGAVIYLRQEGRGIGLGNKIRAYALQERGADTVDANTMLGFQPDERRYDVAAAMLRDLGVRSIALMTNNPTKVDALAAEGITVSRRVEHSVEPNVHSRDYLVTKVVRMGHLIDGEDLGLPERDRLDAE